MLRGRSRWPIAEDLPAIDSPLMWAFALTHPPPASVGALQRVGAPHRACASQNGTSTPQHKLTRFRWTRQPGLSIKVFLCHCAGSDRSDIANMEKTRTRKGPVVESSAKHAIPA